MKLHLTTAANQNIVTGYGDDHIEVNQTRYSHGILLMADQLAPWGEAGLDGLGEADFAALLTYQPEVVVFGSGARMRFVHPRLTAALINAGIGVETMDTGAACRTYNILMGENRRVLAAMVL